MRNIWPDLMPRRTTWLCDAMVIAGAAAVFFLGPWGCDDGWAYLTVANHAITGRFSYVIGIGDAEYSFGKAWFFLLSAFYMPGHAGPLAMRLPSMLLAMLTWLVMRQLVVARHGDKHGPIAAAAFIMIVCMPLLITLRQESLYVAAAALGVQAASASAARAAVATVAAGLAAAAAAAAHPMGLVSGVYAAIAAMRHWPRAGARDRAVMIGGAGVATAAFVQMLLWNLDADAFLSAFRQIAVDPAHARKWHEEWWRYLRLLYVQPLSAAILFSATAAYIWNCFLLPPSERRTGLAQVGVTAALLIANPAKWESYLVIWLPLACLGAAAVFSRTNVSRAAVGLLAIAIGITATIRLPPHDPALLNAFRGKEFLPQATAAVAGRSLLAPPALHPFIAGYAALTPIDERGVAPEVVIIGEPQSYFMSHVDDPALYRQQTSFSFDGIQYLLYVRGTAADS